MMLEMRTPKDLLTIDMGWAYCSKLLNGAGIPRVHNSDLGVRTPALGTVGVCHAMFISKEDETNISC